MLLVNRNLLYPNQYWKRHINSISSSKREFCSSRKSVFLSTSLSINKTKKYFGTWSEDPLISEVNNWYNSSHIPIGIKRKNGPPYTDTSKLETLPERVYHDHLNPSTIHDKVAWGLVRFFRIFTHLFFRDKYGHHAVVLETVAAVPGMIGGMFRHFKSLRWMQRDHGWIGKLLEEAENERMHLLTWMQVIKPTVLERLVVLGAQAFYAPFYALIYIISPKTAHRFVGYLEEEACEQYSLFLNAIDNGKIPNVDAPEIALNYWNLAPNSKLRDVVLCVRADEAMHRNVNHHLSEKISKGK
jgi:ubiquinol oxidase